MKLENVRMVDLDGAIHSERTVSMDSWKQRFAIETPDRTLADAIAEADILGNARMIGPFLLGLEESVHILIPPVSGRGIFNLTALAVADIHWKREATKA